MDYSSGDRGPRCFALAADTQSPELCVESRWLRAWQFVMDASQRAVFDSLSDHALDIDGAQRWARSGKLEDCQITLQADPSSRVLGSASNRTPLRSSRRYWQEPRRSGMDFTNKLASTILRTCAVAHMAENVSSVSVLGKGFAAEQPYRGRHIETF
jgi:hypothetical protein